MPKFPDVFFYLTEAKGSFIQPTEILNHPGNLYADLSIHRFKSLQDLASEGNLQLLKQLLSAGSNINDRDWAGRTALHCAANAGEQEVVEWLLIQGADATLKDRGGDTPLDRASKNGFCGLDELIRSA